MAGFQFVVFGDEKPDTRRAIRSHVMMGKNAGRKLPPRQRKKRDGAREGTAVSSTGAASQSHESRAGGSSAKKAAGGRRRTAAVPSDSSRTLRPIVSFDELMRIPGVVGHELSWLAFPDGFTPVSVDLFRSFYYSLSRSPVPTFCLPKDHSCSFFWRFSIVDNAFMHAMIAIIGTLQRETLSATQAPRLILSHVSSGLHLVNKQIDDVSSHDVSDMTIASILLMSMYERLRGDYARASVHLRGLKHIIDLRGGISELYHTRGLASKICRADIDLALHFGTATVFRAAETLPALEMQGGGQLGLVTASLVPDVAPEHCYGVVSQLSPRYSDVMRDLLRITAFFNTTDGAPVMDVYGLEALLVNMTYRIVELRPLRQSNAKATSPCNRRSSSRSRTGGSHSPEAGNQVIVDCSGGGGSGSITSSSVSSSSTPAPVISNIDDACHLGMAAFMTTLLVEFGSQQLVTHELLRHSLKASVLRLSSSGVQNLRAALWLCFVGGISVFKVDSAYATTTSAAAAAAAAATTRRNAAAAATTTTTGRSNHGMPSRPANTNEARHPGSHDDSTSTYPATEQRSAVDDDGTWLLPQIHELSQDLGLEDWPAVLAVLGEFPWVRSLHDKQGQALWDAVAAAAEVSRSLVSWGLGSWSSGSGTAVGTGTMFQPLGVSASSPAPAPVPPGWNLAMIGASGDTVLTRGNHHHHLQPIRLKPLQTLTHEPGVTLTHRDYGVWR
ncbi:uncharacterized protein B0I36DRAFT_141083 [Microdochium trichocladiopsis]|uniref:Uncharacterized protein n=1 Tax=Microdochium trichocladiopsis TaxID=1682393 RepID=A0A9P8Y358_9PEZI|nr:uncharacterized protein B0I36DRAFT_141083 [Microdochium trichocladiopsis]KAH7027629.1 hypothetical protein B0I36DRAFT_141083 [Microdochium trichocladiopsis]